MKLKTVVIEWLHSARNFFEKLNPIVATLILMLAISVPVTLISIVRDKGINRESREGIQTQTEEEKLPQIAFDWVIKTPVKEEIKFRGHIAAITLLRNFEYLKPFIILENPVIYLAIILPGIIWAKGHVIFYSALVDSVLLGLLVFKIGGVRGWFSSLLVHIIINFSVFIGFAINTLIK